MCGRCEDVPLELLDLGEGGDHPVTHDGESDAAGFKWVELEVGLGRHGDFMLVDQVNHPLEGLHRRVFFDKTAVVIFVIEGAAGLEDPEIHAGIAVYGCVHAVGLG